MKKIMVLLLVMCLLGLGAEPTNAQAITPEEAVVLAEPYGGDTRDCVMSNSGETLQEVAQAISQLPYEVVAFFSARTGDKLGEFTCLNAGRVVVPDAEMKKICAVKGGIIQIHNHPSYDTAFSSNDIKSAAMSKVKKTIVVSRWTTYVLKLKKGASWPRPQKAYNAHRQNVKLGRRIAELQAELAPGSMTLAEQKAFSTDWAVRKTAKRFRLKYTSVKHGADGEVRLSSAG